MVRPVFLISAWLYLCAMPFSSVGWAQSPQRFDVGNLSWTDAESWNTRTIPAGNDSVFVPGWVGTSVANIAPGKQTFAGTLLVGGRNGADGSIELIQSTLELTEAAIEGVPDAGRIYIGRDKGVGLLRQSGGLVRVVKSVHIGTGSDSVGRYTLNGGILDAIDGVVLATDGASGTLEVNGSNCSLIAGSYVHASANAALRMTADASGFSRIVSQRGVTLAGTIRLDLSRFPTVPDETILIENRTGAQVTGGFSAVTIIGSDEHEIAYDGGDGNDVVLRKIVKQFANFEEWKANYLPSLPAGRTPLYADNDSDGMSNLVEYKLRGDPTNKETWQDSPTKSGGRWRYRYVEDLTRTDVMLVPQVLRSGYWRSDRLTLEVIEESETSRLVEASFKGGERPFRFHAELMPEPDKKMNVVLLMVDDLNDWVGCLGGHSQASTPHLDALASRGVLFTNAHSAGSSCNASRTAMLTGMQPGSTGIYRNEVYFRQSPVLKDVVTLPEQLALAGYETAYAGKVFHGGSAAAVDWSVVGPERRGYTRIQNPNAPKTGAVRDQLDWSGIDAPDEDFFDHKVATWGIERLGQQSAEGTHFLALGFYLPHLPWYAPERFFNRLSVEEILLPQSNVDDAADVPAFAVQDTVKSTDEQEIAALNLHKSAVHGYLSVSSFVDEQVGRVMTKLDTLPSLRNTIIVLVSDHGTHLGEKGHWRKGTLWRRASRVPMIVVAPGTTTPGSQVTQPVSLIDIYPTLMELTGTEAPVQLQGQSLVPDLRDPRAAQNRKVLITRRPKQRVLEDGRWRFIYYRPGVEELYDIRNDPDELVNLANDPEYNRVRRNFRRKLPSGLVPIVKD